MIERGKVVVPALVCGLQVTVSVIIVALFLLYEAGPSSSPHFMALLQALLPWAMHHRHAVRVPVQVSQGA